MEPKWPPNEKVVAPGGDRFRSPGTELGFGTLPGAIFMDLGWIFDEIRRIWASVWLSFRYISGSKLQISKPPGTKRINDKHRQQADHSEANRK